MANWCKNEIELIKKHSNEEEYNKILKAICDKEFLEFFVPEPKDLKNSLDKDDMEDLCSWTEENWGTNQDIISFELVENYFLRNVIHIELKFETAWTPPLKVYEEMTRKGWYVNASYVEFGNSLCGLWDSDCDMPKED